MIYLNFQQIKRSLKLGIAISIVIIVFNIFTTSPSHIPQSSDKIQAVWLTHRGNSLLSYTGLMDNVFHRLSLQNFNRIYVDVYNGGTTYPSHYAPRNNLVSLPFTDPFAAAIQEGKLQGLKIYGWYEHGMMVFDGGEIANQHPDWILTTSEGEQFIDRHLWLNPENPEVIQYFINLFTEVATNYPNLEGIQLDDHWGIPIQFGNKVEAMTNLTRQVVNSVRQVRPNLVISISPNPYQFSLEKYSLDWLTWVKKGLFDEVIVQIYRQNSTDVAQIIPDSGLLEASSYVPVAVGIFAGGNAKFTSLTEIKKQINLVEQLGYGYSLFCWEYSSIPSRKIISLLKQIRSTLHLSLL